MTVLRCPTPLIDATLRLLQETGREGREGIVLWLSDRRANEHAVASIYVPSHEAAEDYFWIPPDGMRAMMSHLTRNKLRLVAQVHSHPHQAFHSDADNVWSIARHKGALSLVIPHFARGCTAATFADAAAIFYLDEKDRWQEVEKKEVFQFFEVTR